MIIHFYIIFRANFYINGSSTKKYSEFLDNFESISFKTSMASLKLQSLYLKSSISSRRNHKNRCFQATLQAPNSPKKNQISLASIPAMVNMEKLTLIHNTKDENTNYFSKKDDDKLILAKLYTIAEAVADRAEMHSIIGHQRNDWNQLFLASINSITLTATVMSAISSMNPSNNALNASSALLFGSAASMMLLINKLQSSQLAEEQRKATQLFKQLEKSIHTTISIGSCTELDVEEYLEKVVAIDKAYPLPLLPLLEKFPKKVEPAKWWPQSKQKKSHKVNKINNGWSDEVEEEMRGALRVMKAKDEVQYVECGELAVKINKAMAIVGPVLAGLAAVGSSQISNGSSWPVLFATVGGALATVVNTMEHGGQIGMVFELFRNSAGYYRNLEEEIERNLAEEELDKRVDGELFRMKMALHLGRSSLEMKKLASYAALNSCLDEDIDEFAGKLF